MHLIYEQLKKDKTMSHANYKREEVKEDIESVQRGWRARGREEADQSFSKQSRREEKTRKKNTWYKTGGYSTVIFLGQGSAKTQNASSVTLEGRATADNQAAPCLPGARTGHCTSLRGGWREQRGPG